MHRAATPVDARSVESARTAGRPFIHPSVYPSVRPSDCLFRKLRLEISFRLRCTSYLSHAATPPRSPVQVQNRACIFFVSVYRPTSTTRSPAPPAAPSPSLARLSPTARAIVSREDRKRHNRERTGNKTASPPVLLLETPHASIADPFSIPRCAKGVSVSRESTTPSVSSPFPPRFPKFGCPLREPPRLYVPLARSYPIFRC